MDGGLSQTPWLLLPWLGVMIVYEQIGCFGSFMKKKLVTYPLLKRQYHGWLLDAVRALGDLHDVSKYISEGELKTSNEQYTSWARSHLELLNRHLDPTLGRFGIFISGSRSEGINTAYPESDIDMAIVSDNKETLDSIYRILPNIYSSEFGVPQENIHRLVTKAGLPIVYVENFVRTEDMDIHKLDFSFRTWEQHNTILKGIAENKQAIFGESGTNQYTNVMRLLYLHKNQNGRFEDLYNSGKFWMRILNQK